MALQGVSDRAKVEGFHYGAVEAPPSCLGPGLEQQPPRIKRAVTGPVVALVAVACLVLAVAAVQSGSSSRFIELAQGCDDITCMMNSPTKPPGAVSPVPRTLGNDEVAKLQAALKQEQLLEAQVTADINALAGESKVNVVVKMSPEGVKGPRGPPGPAGPSGPHGELGPTGPVGPQGFHGNQGPQGMQGVAGPAGGKGEPGKEGPTGPAGQQGPMGDQGPEGPKGAEGAPGPVGPEGPEPPAGPAGPVGPQGIVGPPGQIGAQGEAGPPAPAPGMLESTTINPVTGDSVAGVTVQAWNNGVMLGSAVSDSEGYYSFSVPAGPVQILASMDGYQTYTSQTMILPRMVDSDRIMMVPALPEGAAAIVLVWDKVIPDMDLHMTTPWGCNVDWTNYVCTNPSGPGKAHLDRDDVYGGGPETQTIDEPSPGIFQVFVHRYSSGDIMLSRAEVYVFQSDGRIFRFSLVDGDGAVSGDDGDIWTVCDIDGETGNVVSYDNSRKILELRAGGAVTVAELTNFPTQKLSATFWILDLGDNFGTPFSYAVGDEASEFVLSNVKAFQVCVKGTCTATNVGVNDGAWHHVGITWDAAGAPAANLGNTVLYIDGNPVWTGDLGLGESLVAGGTLMIGNVQTAAGTAAGEQTGLTGEVADFEVVGRSLTAVEMQRAMLTHVTSEVAGLVVGFPMTQTDDQVSELHDVSAAGKNGALSASGAKIVAPGFDGTSALKPPTF